MAQGEAHSMPWAWVSPGPATCAGPVPYGWRGNTETHGRRASACRAAPYPVRLSRLQRTACVYYACAPQVAGLGGLLGMRYLLPHLMLVAGGCAQRLRHARRVGSRRAGRARLLRARENLEEGEEAEEGEEELEAEVEAEKADVEVVASVEGRKKTRERQVGQGRRSHSVRGGARVAVMEEREGEGEEEEQQGSCLRVVFEWGAVQRSGTLRLDVLSSVAELLEAVVELGEVLVDINISVAQSVVYYTSGTGVTKRLNVGKTLWAELRAARELVVRKSL